MANQTIMTVASVDMKKLKNAEHVQLHTNVMNVIEGADAEAIGLLETIYGPYTSAIMEEQDIVNKAYASAYTIEMQKADEERVTTFRRVMKKLELCEYENTASVAYKASETVKKHLINPYKSADVVKLPYQEKTATLTGFIKDCREILTSEQVSGIGIDGDLDDLQMANQKFERMYQQRVDEKVVGNQQLSEVLRSATDQAFQLLVVNLNMMCNDPTTAKAAQVSAARIAVGKINVVIAEAKARVAQRLTGLACVIEHVTFDVADGMPVLLNEEVEFRVIGKNLVAKKLTLELVVKPQGMLAEIVVMNLDEFCSTYKAHISLSKDENTGFDVMSVSGWQLGENEVTLGSIG